MFVADELRLGAGLDAARAGLAKLAHRGLLMSISARAYSEGLTGVLWAGSLPSVHHPAFKLVNVHSGDLVMRDDSAELAVRWEATGPDGIRFPALDADIILVPAGEAATLLQIIGVYRPPPGPPAAGLDRTILPGVAEATIQAFIRRVAGSIGLGSSPARMPGNGEARPVQPGT